MTSRDTDISSSEAPLLPARHASNANAAPSLLSTGVPDSAGLAQALSSTSASAPAGRFATPLPIAPLPFAPRPIAPARERTPLAKDGSRDGPRGAARPMGRDGVSSPVRRTSANATRSSQAPRTVISGKRDQDPFQQIWQGMRQHLKGNYPTLCRQWFDELLPLGIAGGALEMRTRSILHRDYLRRQCSDAFNDAARSVSGRLLSVRFLGPEDESQAAHAALQSSGGASAGGGAAPGVITSGNAQPEPAGVPQHAPTQVSLPVEPVAMPESRLPVEVLPPPAPRRSAVTVHEPAPRYETLVVNPDYSFEHFVIGPHNRLAHAAAKAVADNPGRAYNPLFIHGGVGLGKTHLLQAVCLKIVEANPSSVLYYTSCEGFVTQYLESVANNEMAQFRHRFRDVDVLIIDDIHFLTKRDRSQEEFFHTFNALFQQQRQLILSSDAPPEEIPDLEERLVSRFKWGLVAHIAQPDYETRIEILKNKARLRGLSMPDDVPAYIAQNIDKNIRELEGAITKLQLLSLVENAPISIELARRAIGEKAKVDSQEPTIQGIISAVTDFYQIRMSDLQSQLRQRSIAQPRHICMYLARRSTRLSLEEIGGFFGGRDHTTVMHAVKTVELRMATDPEFVTLLRELELRARQSSQERR